MTAYLDEYIPGTKRPQNRVQIDRFKLKFNNIQSCIAVTIFPSHNNHMVGVHLTTSTTGNPQEMKVVRDELAEAMGRAVNPTAYLVANYRTHHASTTLKRELAKIVRSVKLCNISGVSEKNTAANVDVKFEIKGGRVICGVREHAEFRTRPDGSRINKVMPVGGWTPGKPRVELDTDGLVWQFVPFSDI